MQSSLFSSQGPTTASQQMDDLFDVLIESGGEEQRTSKISEMLLMIGLSHVVLYMFF